MNRKLHTLSIDAKQGLPTAFRLLAFGENENDNGEPFVLDPKMVAAILSKIGPRELMIDLEHLSLDKDSIHYNPDAVGWAKVEARSDGLWAAQVRWTPEGAMRLKQKKQKYISPAFSTDEKGRVTELVNVALTALPAMRDLQPLVAAKSRRRKVEQMAAKITPEVLSQVAGALGMKASASVNEIMHALSGAPAEMMAGLLPEEEKEEESYQQEALPPPPPESNEEEDEEEEPLEEESLEVMAAKSKEMTTFANALAKQKKDYEKLARKYNELANSINSSEREALIVTNRDKLPGKLQEWAKTVDLKTLKTFLESAPSFETDEFTPPAEERVIKLSRIDEEMSKRFGTDPKKVLELRKRDAQRAKGA